MTGSFEVLLTAGAEGDLAEIHGWIANHRSPDQARDFLEDMLERIDTLERFPLRGSIPPELDELGIREFRQVLRLPYRILYRVIGEQVFILLIADGRRDFQALLERRLLTG
jgi:toxin ParE1/3/4